MRNDALVAYNQRLAYVQCRTLLEFPRVRRVTGEGSDLETPQYLVANSTQFIKVDGVPLPLSSSISLVLKQPLQANSQPIPIPFDQNTHCCCGSFTFLMQVWYR